VSHLLIQLVSGGGLIAIFILMALESAGIESMVSADDAGGVQPGLWMNGVKVFVREPDAVRALEILNAG